MARRKHVFISYHNANEDLEFAMRLYADLKNRGFDVWVDRVEGIQGEEEWLKKLDSALRDCMGLIVVVSTRYVESSFTLAEMDYAYSNYIPVFPVLIHNLDEVEKKNVPTWAPLKPNIDFCEWRNDEEYYLAFEKLIESLHEGGIEAGGIPDEETQYLTRLIATLEARRGVLEYVDLAAEAEIETPVSSEQENKNRPDPKNQAEFNPEFELRLDGTEPTDKEKEEAAARLAKQDAQSSQEESQDKQSHKSKNQAGPEEVNIQRITLNSIQQAQEEHPRFVLIGDPGAGKTTTLRYLALVAAHTRLVRPRAPLPVLLYLPAWVNEAHPVDFILANSPIETEYDLLEMLINGEAMLFLDGLNEMGASGQQKAALLKSWLATLEGTPAKVIVTCRTADYSREFKLDLPTVMVQAMDKKRIQQFIFNYLGREQGQAFVQQLFGDSPPEDGQDNKSIGKKNQGQERQLIKLARNPYLLTALLFVYENAPDGDLPRNAGALFRRLAMVLWQRERHRKTPGWIPFEEMEIALGRLAFDMTDRDMPIDVSRRWAAEQLMGKHGSTARTQRRGFAWQRTAAQTPSAPQLDGEAASNLLHAAHSANLMEIRGHQVRFYHQLMQEYFAAVGLREVGFYKTLPGTISFNNAYGRQAYKWDEVVIALSGIVPEPDKTVQELARGGFFVGDPWLAARCMMSGINVSSGVRDAIIRQMVDYLNHDYVGVRITSGKLVAEIGKPAVEFLIRALSHSDYNKRWRAAEALGKIGDSRAMKPLVPLLDDEQSLVRQHAAAALGLTGDKSVLPDLIRVLQDNQTAVRREAVKAVGKIGMGEQAAVSAIQGVLLDDDAGIRQNALEALEDLGDPAATPEIAEALFDDNLNVAKAAARTLSVLGDLRAVPHLIEILDDKNATLRQAAAEALGKIGALSELLKICRDDNPQIREGAIYALGYIRQDGAIAALIEEFNSPEPLKNTFVTRTGYSRQPALRSGSTYGARPATGRSTPRPVTHALSSLPDHPVAREALERIGYEAIPGLINALGHENEVVRSNAARTTGKIGDPDIVPALIERLHDDSADVRQSAIAALRDIGESTATSGLLKALEDENPDVRRLAAQALAKLQDEKAISGLIKGLEDRNADVQVACADALGQIGSMRAILALSQGIDDETLAVSLACVRALGEIRSPDCIHALKEALDDDGLYDEIIAALGKIRHANAAAVLVQELINPSSETPSGNRSFFSRGGQNLSSVSTALQQIGTPAVSALLDLLKLTDVGIQQKAAGILGRIGNKKAVQPLLELIPGATDNPGLKKEIIIALKQIGDAAAIIGVGQLLDDSDHAIRLAVVDALRAFGGQKVWAGLAYALQDREAAVRSAAAQALGELGAVDIVPQLAAMLDDENEKVCKNTIKALEHIGDPAAIPALITVLKHPNKSLRSDAATTLKRIGWQPETTKEKLAYYSAAHQWDELAELGESAIPALLEFTDDNNQYTRLRAVKAVAQIGNSSNCIPALFRFMYDSYDNVRREAVNALKKSRRIPLSSVVKVIYAPDNKVRLSALDIVMELAPPELTDHTLDMIRDNEAGIRSAAAKALGTIGYTLQNTASGQSRVRGRFFYQRYENDLDGQTGQNQKSGSRQSPFAYPPGEQHSPFARPVEELHHRPTPPVQRRSPFASEPLESDTQQTQRNLLQEIIEALVEALRDVEESVRRAAAGALGEIQSPLAIPALKERLLLIQDFRKPKETHHVIQQADKNFIMAIFGAFGKIGDSAFPVLEEILSYGHPDSNDETMAEAGVKALGEIGNEKGMAAIVPYLTHKSPRVRKQTAESIGKIFEEFIKNYRAPLQHRRSFFDRDLDFEDSIHADMQKPEKPESFERALKSLQNCLTDTDATVRRAVLEALGKTGQTAAVLSAAAAVTTDDNFNVRKVAVEILKDLPETQDILKPFLRDSDARIRKLAAESIRPISRSGFFRDRFSRSPRETSHRIPSRHETEEGEKERLANNNSIFADKTTNITDSIDYLIAMQNWYGCTRKGTKAIPALLAILDDSDLRVRHEAIKTLGNIGGESIIAPLIERFLKEKTYNTPAIPASSNNMSLPRVSISSTEEIIIRTLKPFEKKVIQELAVILAEDNDPDRRAGAAKAAGMLSGEDAIPGLVAALKDVDSMVRFMASRSLRQLWWRPADETIRIKYAVACQNWRDCLRIGNASIPHLVKLLGDENVYVQRRVVETLRELNWEPAPDKPEEHIIFYLSQENYDACLESGDISRTAAALVNHIQTIIPQRQASTGQPAKPHSLSMALGKAGNVAIPYLVDLLHNPGLPSNKKNSYVLAMEALAEIDTPESLDALVEFLHHDEQAIKIEAIKQLGRKGNAAYIPMLEQGLKNEASIVRQHTIVALAESGGHRVIPVISPFLNDNERTLRMATINAITEMVEGEAGLYQALYSDYQDVREKAETTLKKAGTVPELQALLRDNNGASEFVCEAVARLIGEIGMGTDVPELIDLLSHQDRFVRRAALETLEKIENSSAVPILIHLLNRTDDDSDDDARREEEKNMIIEALGKIGNRSAIPALMDIIRDKNTYLRDKALEALVNIGEFTAELLTILDDEQDYLRDGVVMALGHVGNEQAIPRLLDMAKSAAVKDSDAQDMKDIWLFETAIQTIRKIGGQIAVQALTELLDAAPISLSQQQRQDYWISTLNALKAIAHQTAIPELIQIINDNNDEVIKENAILTLQQVVIQNSEPEHKAAVIETMQKVLRSHPASFRKLAIKILDLMADNDEWDRAVYGDIWLRALNDESIRIQQTAAKAIGKMPLTWQEKIAPHLLKQAGEADGDSEPGDFSSWRFSQDAAIAALGEIGHPSAIPALVDIIHAEREKRRQIASEKKGRRYRFYAQMPVLYVAIEAVGKIIRQNQQQESVIALFREWLDDDDSSVRYMVIEALGHIESKSTVSALEYALNDSHPDNKNAAITALGDTGRASSVPLLHQILNEHFEKITRLSAERGLRNRTEQNTLQTVFSLTAKALGKIQKRLTDDSVILMLQKYLLENVDVQIGQTIMGALAETDKPEAVSILCQFVEGQINNYHQNSGEGRTRRLGDNQSLSSAGLKALGNIGTPEAVAFLENCLTDDLAYLRISVIDALGQAGSPDKPAREKAIALLMALPECDNNIAGSDNNVVIRIIKALGKTRAPAALSWLIERINSPLAALTVQKAAFEALQAFETDAGKDDASAIQEAIQHYQKRTKAPIKIFPAVVQARPRDRAGSSRSRFGTASSGTTFGRQRSDSSGRRSFGGRSPSGRESAFGSRSTSGMGRSSIGSVRSSLRSGRTIASSQTALHKGFFTRPDNTPTALSPRMVFRRGSRYARPRLHPDTPEIVEVKNTPVGTFGSRIHTDKLGKQTEMLYNEALAFIRGREHITMTRIQQYLQIGRFRAMYLMEYLQKSRIVAPGIEADDEMVYEVLVR